MLPSRIIRITGTEKNAEIETRILMSFIVSTHFCATVFPNFKPEYVADILTRKIISWVKLYFNQHNEAPLQNIEALYDINKSNLTEAESTWAEQFLAHLSSQYESLQSFNTELYIDEALGYFRCREVELRSRRALAYIDSGKLDAAEQELTNYHDVSIATTQWVNPLDHETIDNAFSDANTNSLFQLSGDTGKLIGPFRRGWLVALASPFKRGKSWWLQEIALQALFNRLKVVFISLEMPTDTVVARILKRLTGCADSTGQYVMPVMDCAKNQGLSTIECTNRNRMCQKGIGMKLPDHITPEFVLEVNKSYRPCTYCLDSQTWGFTPTGWFEVKTIRQLTPLVSKYRVDAVKQMYGDNFRIVAYPRFTANLSDIKNDLNLLRTVKGFFPDVVVIDYADILAPERNLGEHREEIDETWKTLGSMGATDHCLVATASQVGRKALETRNISETHLAEWIGKLAHTDVFAALHQSKAEKTMHMMRFGLLGHRHKEFDVNKHVTVLYQFAIGGVNIFDCLSGQGPQRQDNDNEEWIG